MPPKSIYLHFGKTFSCQSILNLLNLRKNFIAHQELAQSEASLSAFQSIIENKFGFLLSESKEEFSFSSWISILDILFRQTSHTAQKVSWNVELEALQSDAAPWSCFMKCDERTRRWKPTSPSSSPTKPSMHFVRPWRPPTTGWRSLVPAEKKLSRRGCNDSVGWLKTRFWVIFAL